MVRCTEEALEDVPRRDASAPHPLSESKPTSERSPYRPLIGMAVLVLFVLLASAGFKSYRDLAAARAHETELARQIEASEDRIRLLRDYVRTIEDDPLTLERLAREQLGLVRPGDVVIVLPEDSLSPRASRAERR
jgi:cell division protein FtsB